MTPPLILLQRISLLILLVFPTLSISWPGPVKKWGTRLSARKPSDNGGSEGPGHGEGPSPAPSEEFHSEPIQWVAILHLPAKQEASKDAHGTPFTPEERSQYFQEMVDVMKDIRAENTESKYWASGPSGAGEGDLWYFCPTTSTERLIQTHHAYGDLIASIRPLASLYPARKLKVVPQGFIRNRKRTLGLDNNDNIKPRDINITSPNPAHILGKRVVLGQLRAPRELRALGVSPWIWIQEGGWDKIQYNYDTRQGDATQPQVVVYVICKGVDINHPEFSDIDKREIKDWIWGAGTAVFGKIFGKTLGTARQAKPVVVVAADENGRTSRLHILDSLLKIHADISKRFKGRKIVISMSWILTFLSYPKSPGSKMDTFDYHLIESIRHILELLNQLGVTFVVPGGSVHWDDSIPSQPGLVHIYRRA
ncbi:hypothetical protein TWF481_000662 [Arthrobotrys musiformis]|uniref:Uncharacterized protein n=1 Tax=Arthrobotrys musiformis TaxID=47236 RepID=A0AAV9WTZ6_9PEZI